MGASEPGGFRRHTQPCRGLCFRGVQASDARREVDCVFCALEGSGRVLLENELAILHRRCLFP